LKSFVPDINIINQINDRPIYAEMNGYIDERNRNTKFFNSLLLKKYDGIKLNIKELSLADWKQLIIKECITNKLFAELFDMSIKEIQKERKKIYQIVRNMLLNIYFINT